MANLQTTYMGIELQNPIIVGANEMTGHIESVKKIDAAGAGALVVKSLFEEQIQLEGFQLQDELTRDNYRHAEMVTLHPKMEHAGPKEHLMQLKKIKEAVKIPVIASLNCVNRETWLDYAKQIQETGVDGIELNFYASPQDRRITASAIEDEQVRTVQEIIKVLSIPVSVKLSFFYTNPFRIITRLNEVGVKGFVLFNRLFQPDIDIENEKLSFPFNLSVQTDNRLPLRYAGLLYGQVQADVCSSTGIFTGSDVVKMLLAGSQCVQVVSALYNKNIEYLTTMLKDLSDWMDVKKYAALDDFRGKLSKKNSKDPWAYERAQYVKLLFEAENIMKSSPLP